MSHHLVTHKPTWNPAVDSPWAAQFHSQQQFCCFLFLNLLSVIWFHLFLYVPRQAGLLLQFLRKRQVVSQSVLLLMADRCSRPDLLC